MSTPIIPPTPQAKPEGEKNPGKPDVKSTLPEPPKPAEGSTTIEKDIALECEILAFQSLEKIARMIANEILRVAGDDRSKRPKRICILDDLSVRALEAQQASELQTAHLQAVFERIQEQVNRVQVVAERETGMEMVGFSAAVGVVTTLAGLLRQDIMIQGVALEPSQEAFLNSVTRYLLRMDRDVEIRNANLLAYSPGVREQASHSRILDRFNGVERARFNAEAAMEKLARRVLELQFLLEPPSPKPQPPAEESKPLSDELALKMPVLQAAVKWMEQTVARWTEIQKVLDTEDTGHHSGLGLLGRGEEILAWAQALPSQTYFLAARCLSLRGNFKTRKGIFTNLGGKDSSSYSGSAVATYALLDSNALIRVSGTHRFRMPYLQFEEGKAVPETGNSFNEEFEVLD